MNLRIFDGVDDLLHAAARTLVQRAAASTSFSIALSGGSTPQPLYTMLGQSPLRQELSDVAITWVVVDERYVPIDDPQSNAGMMNRTLFAEGMSLKHRFLPFLTDFPQVSRSAVEFESKWIEFGLDALDVVILGMGDDGHTASLFPGTTALAVNDRIATEVFVPKLDMWRVTITKPVIRAAKLRIVLAAGASKQPLLRALREGADYPIAEATSGLDTWWFVDRSAAPD
ncbi:MAG: 6-phosphogluconolactonase, partial [Acidobacteriota bacterium]